MFSINTFWVPLYIYFQSFCCFSTAKMNKNDFSSNYFMDSLFSEIFPSNNTIGRNINESAYDIGDNTFKFNEQTSKNHSEPGQFISHLPSKGDNTKLSSKERMFKLLSLIDILKYLGDINRKTNNTTILDYDNSQKDLISKITNRPPKMSIKHQIILSNYFGMNMKAKQQYPRGLNQKYARNTASPKKNRKRSFTNEPSVVDIKRKNARSSKERSNFKPDFTKLSEKNQTQNKEWDAKTLVH